MFENRTDKQLVDLPCPSEFIFNKCVNTMCSWVSQHFRKKVVKLEFVFPWWKLQMLYMQ